MSVPKSPLRIALEKLSDAAVTTYQAQVILIRMGTARSKRISDTAGKARAIINKAINAGTSELDRSERQQRPRPARTDRNADQAD